MGRVEIGEVSMLSDNLRLWSEIYFANRFSTINFDIFYDITINNEQGVKDTIENFIYFGGICYS